MTIPNQDVLFLRPSAAADGAAAGGFESSAAPPSPDAKPTREQSARANDLFLRGALTPEQLSKAKASRGGFELVIGRSNFLPAVFLEIGAATARATCHIRTSGVDFLGRSGVWSGTGYLISPSVMVTNNHVLNSPDVAAAATCAFNFQVGLDGRPLPMRTFRLRPDRLFLTSPAREGLDYTFVWVDGEPGREFGTVRTDRQAFAIAESEFANIVSHPDGRMKEVSVQENEVQWQDDLVVHYTSDTEPGSSGAPVCNNNWQLVALHHASKPSNVPAFQILNEGIKLSAIAADLERAIRSGTSAAGAAQEVLALFGGNDERLGFFGTLGRAPAVGGGLEAVVNTFQGTEQDIDVGFWNVEWLTKHYETKTTAVAHVLHEMNLDVWCLEESSPNAAEAVVAELKNTYGLNFASAAAEPESADGKQSCTLLWNVDTVTCREEAWGEPIETWLRTRSEQFDDLDLGFEAVHGKIFDRYPALFHFTAKRSEGDRKFDFYVVPLHLKAMVEGSLRREMASKILAAAIQKKINEGSDADWVIGGDFNAELASEDFDTLINSGMTPVSADDEQGGAFSYIKGPKSLIDHIFLSPNLAARADAQDFFIVAAERTYPNYVRDISDHRPVLVRLSLATPPGAEAAGGLESAAADAKSAALAELKQSLISSPRPPVCIAGGFERGRAGGREDYQDREGYDPVFHGGGGLAVALPELSAALAEKAVVIDARAGGVRRFVLPYTHFSVVMNGERKLPFYSAVNIHGEELRRFPRSGDNWRRDPRIPAEVQVGDELYRNNDLDRGHMTRRLDPVWGRQAIAAQADADTFHFTNACPQHKDLNQKEWAQLEDYVLGNAGAHELKLSVFTGPILRANDQLYRDIRLPKEFWKVVVMVRSDTRQLSATGYVLSQEDLISGFEFVFGQFKTYQVTLKRIEQRTGLSFGKLVNFDPLARPRPGGGFEAAIAAGAKLVTGPSDLVLA